MKYLISAAALAAAAVAIGLAAGTASADLAHKPQSYDAIKAERAQVRRQLAAAQVCGGSAYTLEGAVLTCFKETR